MTGPCLSCGWRSVHGCTNSKDKWEECIYDFANSFKNHVPRKGPLVPSFPDAFTYKIDNPALKAELKLEEK